jgi:hypothetical protein
VQVIDGSVRVLADFVREGEPSEVASDIIAAAQIEAGGKVRSPPGRCTSTPTTTSAGPGGAEDPDGVRPWRAAGARAAARPLACCSASATACRC